MGRVNLSGSLHQLQLSKIVERCLIRPRRIGLGGFDSLKDEVLHPTFTGNVWCGCNYSCTKSFIWSHSSIQSVTLNEPKCATWSRNIPICKRFPSTNFQLLGFLFLFFCNAFKSCCSARQALQINCHVKQNQAWKPLQLNGSQGWTSSSQARLSMSMEQKMRIGICNVSDSAEVIHIQWLVQNSSASLFLEGPQKRTYWKYMGAFYIIHISRLHEFTSRTKSAPTAVARTKAWKRRRQMKWLTSVGEKSLCKRSTCCPSAIKGGARKW